MPPNPFPFHPHNDPSTTGNNGQLHHAAGPNTGATTTPNPGFQSRNTHGSSQTPQEAGMPWYNPNFQQGSQYPQYGSDNTFQQQQLLALVHAQGVQTHAMAQQLLEARNLLTQHQDNMGGENQYTSYRNTRGAGPRGNRGQTVRGGPSASRRGHNNPHRGTPSRRSSNRGARGNAPRSRGTHISSRGGRNNAERGRGVSNALCPDSSGGIRRIHLILAERARCRQEIEEIARQERIRGREQAAAARNTPQQAIQPPPVLAVNPTSIFISQPQPLVVVHNQQGGHDMQHPSTSMIQAAIQGAVAGTLNSVFGQFTSMGSSVNNPLHPPAMLNDQHSHIIDLGDIPRIESGPYQHVLESIEIEEKEEELMTGTGSSTDVGTIPDDVDPAVYDDQEVQHQNLLTQQTAEDPSPASLPDAATPDSRCASDASLELRAF